MEVKILDVVTEDFFKVTQEVYQDDQMWVQESPENIIRTVQKYDAKVFIGYEDTHSNARVVVFFKKTEAWLGFFEAITCSSGVALLRSVEKFCQERGAKILIGPKVDNLVQGLLVKGFDLPPTILTNYNPKYYTKIFKQAKYKRLTKTITLQFSKKSIKKPQFNKSNVEIRIFDLNNLEKEILVFHELQNRIFSSHDGWEERSLKEDKDLISSFLPMIDPELILIAQIDNKPIGLLICLPDYNQRLRGQVIDNARIVSIGVEKAYTRKGIGLLMAYKIMETLLDKGYKTAEASWILKTNIPPQLLSKKFNAKAGKQYNVYSKKIV